MRWANDRRANRGERTRSPIVHPIHHHSGLSGGRLLPQPTVASALYANQPGAAGGGGDCGGRRSKAPHRHHHHHRARAAGAGGASSPEPPSEPPRTSRIERRRRQRQRGRGRRRQRFIRRRVRLQKAERPHLLRVRQFLDEVLRATVKMTVTTEVRYSKEDRYCDHSLKSILE